MLLLCCATKNARDKNRVRHSTDTVSTRFFQLFFFVCVVFSLQINLKFTFLSHSKLFAGHTHTQGHQIIIIIINATSATRCINSLQLITKFAYRVYTLKFTYRKVLRFFIAHFLAYFKC